MRSAASVAFGLWLGARGGGGAQEARDAIVRTRAFLVANGDARFEDLGAAERRPVIARAGWREAETFWVAEDAWREIHKGADPAHAARTLRDAGYLDPEDRERLKRRTPSAVPDRPRAYRVRASIIGAEDG